MPYIKINTFFKGFSVLLESSHLNKKYCILLYKWVIYQLKNIKSLTENNEL